MQIKNPIHPPQSCPTSCTRSRVGDVEAQPSRLHQVVFDALDVGKLAAHGDPQCDGCRVPPA